MIIKTRAGFVLLASSETYEIVLIPDADRNVYDLSLHVASTEISKTVKFMGIPVITTHQVSRGRLLASISFEDARTQLHELRLRIESWLKDGGCCDLSKLGRECDFNFGQCKAW